MLVTAMFTWFATAAHDTIPVFLDGHRTTTRGYSMLIGIWVLTLLALVAVWQRKPLTVLDVWLMVVLGVWLFDIALAALLNTGRYDLGWYAGRIYGLVAASVLLIVLLFEDTRRYSRLVQLAAELGAANEALAQLSRHDDLTGIANRRHFDEELARRVAMAQRHARCLALVLVDVDRFKNFNDRYGHLAGDACLRLVAGTLDGCCKRPGDLAARYGGEEFAMILPDTDVHGASQSAEFAREAVARLACDVGGGERAAITVSCGVAAWREGMTAHDLVRAADHALYQAKGDGRNRVVCARGQEPARSGPAVLAS